MDDLRTHIAQALKREREQAGLSVSELARRASVSKATVSQLEAAAINPTVETLWALGSALGIPFSALVAETGAATTLIRAHDRAGVPSKASPYVATLLAASPPHVRRDIYVIEADPGNPHSSAPHPAGAIEHVNIMTGRARVGTEPEANELGAGDYLSYPADVTHVFVALEAATSAVLLTELR